MAADFDEVLWGGSMLETLPRPLQKKAGEPTKAAHATTDVRDSVAEAMSAAHEEDPERSPGAGMPVPGGVRSYPLQYSHQLAASVSQAAATYEWKS